MNDADLDLLQLPRAAVATGATLGDAARELFASGVSAVAILDGKEVRGMLTEDDLLRSVFPHYLGELSHTAFLERDELLPHLDSAASTPVTSYARAAATVEWPTSALDLAQRFLHSDATALIAVHHRTFVGVVDQSQFCKAILRRYGWQL